MNRSASKILFVAILYISLAIYFIYFIPYQFILLEQINYFLTTSDFFLLSLTRVQGLPDYIASFLIQFYAIRFVGAGVLLFLTVLFSFLLNKLLKPFIDSSYGFIFSVLFSTAFIWSLHCYFTYPLSNDIAFLISLVSCFVYIQLPQKYLRYPLGIVFSVVLWYVCKEAAFVAYLYIIFYEWKLKRDYFYLFIFSLLFFVSVFLTSYLFTEEVFLVDNQSADWLVLYLCFIFSVPCYLVLGCYSSWSFLFFPAYILLIIDSCYFKVDYNRERELRLSYYMQREEWDKLLESIDDVKKLSIEQLNYYYMALAQTGKLSEQLFQYGFPLSGALVYPVAQSYVSKTRLSDLYWYLGCYRASQFYATEAMSMFETGASFRHIKRLAMIHLIYKENEQAIKFLRILKKTTLYNRWAVKLLNHIQMDPDMDEIDWVVTCRKQLPVHTYQINMKSPLENVTNISMQLPCVTLALEYAHNLALLEKKVDWLVNMVRYKMYLAPTIQIPTLWQEGVLVSEYENHVPADSQLKIKYDKDVLRLFEEFKAMKQGTVPLYSSMTPLKNEYKSSYFYYHAFVDVNK